MPERRHKIHCFTDNVVNSFLADLADTANGIRISRVKNNRKNAVIEEGAFASFTKMAEVDRQRTPKIKTKEMVKFVFVFKFMNKILVSQ